MIKLYWSPRSRSFTAIWLMEETGLRARADRYYDPGAQKAPDYLEGQSDGQGAGAEPTAMPRSSSPRRSAPISPTAIPETKLAPAVSDPLRALDICRRWTAEPYRAGPDPDFHQARGANKHSRLGASATVIRCSTTCLAKGSVDPRRKNFRRPISRSVRDSILAVRQFKMVLSRPSFDAYIARCVERPAFQRAEKIAAG